MIAETRQWVVPGFVGICLMLGGASAAGYLANGLLQMLAIGLLATCYIRRPDQPAIRSERWLQLLMGALCVVILLQFVPLSASIWRGLPGREGMADALASVGIAPAGGFVSLIPHESIKSAVWLLPALAVMVAMIRARSLASADRLAIVIVAAMGVGVFLGALQRFGGEQSPFYFYQFTNRDMAVGMFANGNHMASLLLISIPFQAALLRGALHARYERNLPGIIAISGTGTITVAGIANNGSLAGYGLMLPVLLASVLIVLANDRLNRIAGLLLVPAALGGIALVFLSGDAQYLLDRASSMGAGDRRLVFATSIEAIRDFWPLGSGLGTFAEVYPAYEDPFTVTPQFANHAHNDYIELAFETGLAGLAVLLGFLVWWGIAAWQVWRDANASPFARAAVVATATLLVHSLVDYPLRTAGLAAVFAACCAVIAASRRPTPTRS